MYNICIVLNICNLPILLHDFKLKSLRIENNEMLHVNAVTIGLHRLYVDPAINVGQMVNLTIKYAECKRLRIRFIFILAYGPITFEVIPRIQIEPLDRIALVATDQCGYY